MRSWQKTQTFFLGLRIGGFAIVVLLRRAPRLMRGWSVCCLVKLLERRFVGVAAAGGGRVGRPRVLVAAAAAGRCPLAAVVAAAPVAAAAEPAFAAAAAGPVDLGRSVPQ